MRAADFMVESFKAHGLKRVYCVPGESYLALLDALHGSGIEVIICRHEGGAGFMAVAEAKMTGRPAVAMVSRGPGATNASIAVHQAEQDGVPLILIVGQVSREEKYRHVFQEMDYGAFFGSTSKGVFELSDATRLPEMMPRAFRLAAEGVRGPVVLSLPEDMLHDTVPNPQVLTYPLPNVDAAPSQVDEVLAMLKQAERPLLMAGSTLRGKAGSDALARCADALRVPVATTWKSQDVFDNNSELYAGHTGFGTTKGQREALAEADLIIAVGTRLGDPASMGFTLPQVPQPKQKLIHIYPDSRPIGRVIRADLGIVADPAKFLAALASNAVVAPATRERWISTVHGATVKAQEFKSPNPTDGVDFGAVTVALGKLAPPNAVITMDAGNMTTWPHRHWKMTPDNLLLGAVVGAMGFGVPSAVAASLNDPSRTAICFVGDGGILMTGNELATAIAFGATPKVVLSNNGIYGTIRTHQEREYPGRVSGTKLVNPDFTAWAETFGVKAFPLNMGDDVEAVVHAFLDHKGAALLHVQSSAFALSANGTLPQ
ncbi:thiamine pyrophosphate-binding protein [Aestuariivirga litoralis]|uniref:thiamine pyrophosphate-binding protein n=1 Tax=Aestuariivirga litoralis TaxID=2650924 RepID=UPI0018C49820|nr:thiamine pyrophosphate-binding protein [Aestuariivirga litoralis]MBG1231212.1 acetolactate synthase [Aestuariivirga litoralis]